MPIPINKYDGAETILNILARADGSVEKLFANNPQILALLQQGGQDIENQFANILIAKYPTQFGSLTQAQVVSLINGYPQLQSQLTEAEGQLATANGLVTSTQSADVAAAGSLATALEGVDYASMTSEVQGAIAAGFTFAAPILDDIREINLFTQQIQNDLSTNAPISTLENDSAHLTNAIGSLQLHLNALGAEGAKLPNCDTFLSEFGPTATSGPLVDFHNADSNYQTALGVQQTAQSLVTQLMASLSQFSVLDPLEMNLLNELPGIV